MPGLLRARGVRAACAYRGSLLSAVRPVLLGDRLRRGRLWWGLTGRLGAVVARGAVQRREGARGHTEKPPTGVNRTRGPVRRVRRSHGGRGDSFPAGAP